MHFHVKNIKKRLLVVITLLVTFGMSPLCRAGSTGQVEIDQINSFDEMTAALSFLKTSAAEATAQGAFTYEFQKNILTRAGACISRMAYLCQANKNDPKTVRRAGKTLFSANRDIIKHILTTNEKTIRHFQEVTLDKIEDPQAFFQTPQWQHPQQLISLSSYWLGWNGYYASLVIPENAPLRRQMLEESIDGFSRAFIDFAEEDVVTKSLYGRGLCYRQLNVYQSALYDFKSVKDRIKNDPLLYTRCLYEEAMISYQTGNFRLTLSKLDQIQEVYAKDKIPDTMAASMEQLRADVFLAQLEKKTEKAGEQKTAHDDNYLSTFKEMKQLAVNSGRINERFYQYVQANAAKLEHLAYAELGPVAAMAIGDWYFGKKEYDKALSYYQGLHADNTLTFSQNLDRLQYRTAYIYFEKQQWHKVVGLLAAFYKRYPESRLAKQAASLYYAAASHNYKNSDDSASYEMFIKAIQKYLKMCDSCNGRSEARFHLGRYYQKNGDVERALNEFSKVAVDSSNYYQAKYYVLESCLAQLDELGKKGQVYSEETMRAYQDGVRIIDEWRRAEPDERGAANRKKLQPYMIVLQAKLHLFGGSDAWSKGLELVEGFQDQYPRANALFVDAAKLRVEYYLLLQKAKVFEAEIDGFINTTPMDPSRYAGLHDLADKFYTASKRAAAKPENSDSSRHALAALMIYEKLYTISRENKSYASYCDPIQLRMAQICLEEKRMDRAAELFTDILQRAPHSADAVYGLGLIYERRGQWQKALETWRKFSDGVEAGTHHWFQSRYRTAVALHQLGKTERACTVVTMTLVLHPNFNGDELKKKFLDFQLERCKGETVK
ncbi:MAG: tetratricopeptide repeat protein [Desulfobacteraceae bacterium]|jgi:tetratricopeptide (TPR) repeat protein